MSSGVLLCLDHHANALWLEYILNCLGDLGGKLLLNLQPTGKSMHHARQLRNAYNTVGRQVTHMCPANHRQHMMLTKTDHTDVPQHHQFVITADFLKGALQIVTGLSGVSREQFAIRACYSRWRINQAFAVGIVSRPFNQHSYSFFRIGLRPFRHRCISGKFRNKKRCAVLQAPIRWGTRRTVQITPRSSNGITS